MNLGTLYIFSGLPGAGKSTLAQGLSARLNCTYLRIGTIEQALQELCNFKIEGEGYRLAYQIAAEDLRCGMDVISDSCNPIELTRDEWQDVAIDAGAQFINIEIVCSNEAEHKRRVENRTSNIAGLKLPTWKQVQQREYHPWESNRIRVDTARKEPNESLQELMLAIQKHKAS